MTKRTLLAWFLLLYTCLHAQCARTTIEKQECPKEGLEGNKGKDQISEAGSFGQVDDGHPVLHRSFSSLMSLEQGSRDMSNQSSRNLIARTWTMFLGSGWVSALTRFDATLVAMICAGCMLQVILLTLMVVIYRYTVRGTLSMHEQDDDSDGSVLALGHGLDGFLWLDKSKSSSMITSTSQPLGIKLIAPPWSCAALDDIFHECGLEESWKDTMTDELATELTGELSQGKSSLFLKSSYGSENTGLKCIMYVMQVVLHYVPDNLVLQEFTRPGYKNHFPTDFLRLPKTKMRNHEPVAECFMRCITLKLGLSQDLAESIAGSAVLLRAEEEPTTWSAAAVIPNMSVIVRKLTVLVRLKDVQDEIRKDLGIDEGKLYVDARGMEFQWEKVGEHYGLRKLLKKAPDARKVKPNWKPSENAVLPWSLSDVNKELTSRGVAPVSSGKGFSELVKKLRTGQVQLGVEEASGNLVCVEHRVYLKLSKKNGDFLVREGDECKEASLPYVVLLANETPLGAALRAARSQLGSVFMRVELQLHSQHVQTTFTPEPPNFFSDCQPIAYVVREIVVEALAS